MTSPRPLAFSFFFFNDTATTEIYTLSLHDALPISMASSKRRPCSTIHRRKTPSKFAAPWPSSRASPLGREFGRRLPAVKDRKSTRLNSSHSQISYAVFCLKKKKRAIPPVERQLYDA